MRWVLYDPGDKRLPVWSNGSWREAGAVPGVLGHASEEDVWFAYTGRLIKEEDILHNALFPITKEDAILRIITDKIR